MTVNKQSRREKTQSGLVALRLSELEFARRFLSLLSSTPHNCASLIICQSLAMSTSRLHHHPSLPAPVVHAGFSLSQSKSHVLAGVQDAYWSDDEAVSTSA